MSIVFILLLTTLVNSYTNARFIKSTSHLEEESSNSNIQNWLEETLGDVKSKLHLSLNTNKAKNVIFFMGDGMSVTTITAARIYQGQLKNKSGEEHVLSFEKFPAVGLSKTYCSDQQTVDSGASATAFLAGVKANIFTIGVNSNVKRFDCVAAKDPANRPSNIIDWAQDAGKATGIISSARITDASPAGGYAHVPDRWMESDYDVFKAKMDSSCDFDIAKQLVREDPGKNIKVLMGGGIQKFLPNTTTDVFGKPGERLDTDLIEEWKRDKSKRNLNAKFITQRSDLLNLDISRTDYLLGLFATAHMHYHLENIQHEPTLEEMTTAAIKILQKEDKGFVLYIEGAFIDKAHHENRARLAIDETVELAKAVEAAVKLTNEEDTLIVVTADHSQPLVMNGYAKRGHDILGVTSLEQLAEQDERIKNVFNYNLKYTTLNYGNGPGFSTNIESDLKNNVDIKNMNYRYPSLYAFETSFHAGEDVPVYARGPWSHLFSGIYEQTLIPIAEAYAADIGPSKAIKEMQESSRSNAYLIVHSQIFIVFIIFVTNLI